MCPVAASTLPSPSSCCAASRYLSRLFLSPFLFCLPGFAPLDLPLLLHTFSFFPQLSRSPRLSFSICFMYGSLLHHLPLPLSLSLSVTLSLSPLPAGADHRASPNIRVLQNSRESCGVNLEVAKTHPRTLYKCRP